MDPDQLIDHQPAVPEVSSPIPTHIAGLRLNPNESLDKDNSEHHTPQPCGLDLPITREPPDDEVQYLMTVPRRTRRQKGISQTHPATGNSIMGMDQNTSTDISQGLESCHLSSMRSAVPFQQSQHYNHPQPFPYGHLQYCNISEPFGPIVPIPQRHVNPPQSGLIPALGHGNQAKLRRPYNESRTGQSDRTLSYAPPQVHCYTPLFPTSNHHIDSTSVATEQLLADTLWPPVSAIEQVFPDHTDFNWNTLTWENPPASATASTPTSATIQRPASASTDVVHQGHSSSGPHPVVEEEQQPSLPPAYVNSADLRRKPTLYKIPAWTPPTCVSSTPADSQSPPMASGEENDQAAPSISQNCPRPPPQPPCFIPSVVPPPRFSFNCESFLRSPIGTPKSPVPVSPRTTVPRMMPSPPISNPNILAGSHEQSRRNNESLANEHITVAPRAGALQAVSPNSQRTTQPLDSYQKSRSSDQEVQSRVQTHSPNLIVDIAQTCQERFPFEEVARRHNTKIEKVMDTFSAIIQLPLLRNASDSRRHGPLGAQRMKDFREAKKAAKSAQIVARKAAKHSQRSHCDEPVSKKIKVGEVTEDLRKAALLKNTLESQVSSAS